MSVQIAVLDNDVAAEYFGGLDLFEPDMDWGLGDMSGLGATREELMKSAIERARAQASASGRFVSKVSSGPSLRQRRMFFRVSPQAAAAARQAKKRLDGLDDYEQDWGLVNDEQDWGLGDVGCGCGLGAADGKGKGGGGGFPTGTVLGAVGGLAVGIGAALLLKKYLL